MPENENPPAEQPSSQPAPKYPEKIINIARVCHEANRAYCLGLGDKSQKPWSEAPDWQKESAINGVLAIINTNGHDPSASHRNWMKEKIETGWKYGEVKDEKAKTHPCMVPFDQLPPEQRMKDYLFLSIVRTLIVVL